MGDGCVRRSKMERISLLNKNNSLNSALYESGLTNLQKYFSNTYQRQGESSYCVKDLQCYAKKYYRSLENSMLNRFDFKRLVSKAIEKNCHQAFSLEKTDATKMSLHVMPKGSEIPTHAHPNQFSLIIVDTGKLEVVQNSWGCRTIETDSTKLLMLGDINIGLPIKDNLHQLRAITDVVFYSIRISCLAQPKPKQNTPSLFVSKFIASTLCVLIPLVGSMTVRAGETYELYSGYKEKTLFKRAPVKSMTRMQAGRFRQGDNYGQQVDAVEWYKKSARRGNAESQYWLGVMHLEGNGTTEDDEEAFRWVSLAADQGHEPAVKLLNHLINSEFDLEC